MLKKNDLAKQFELLTKQEIKNYNDSLNFVLQSIRDLDDQIAKLKSDFHESLAVIQSAQGKISTDILKNSEEIHCLNKKLDRFINDQSCMNERNAREILDITDALHNKIRSDCYFDNRFREIKNLIDSVSRHSIKTQSQISEVSESLSKKFTNALIKTKNEIIDRPSDLSIFMNKVEEKISAYRIDVSGIMREISVIKKENIVVEKKLESIYTLIDRLKKLGDCK